MSWKRQLQNMDARDRNRREHSAAYWALEDYRRDGNPSGFPNLRRYLCGKCGSLSLAGFRYEEINPRLTQEEYDRFEEAYKATEDGKNDPVYQLRRSNFE